MYGRQNREFAFVKFLIDKGGDVKCQGHFRETVLHGGCLDGSLDLVKLLVSKGADVNAKNIDAPRRL